MAIRGRNLYVAVSDCFDVSASTRNVSQHLIVISYNVHGFNKSHGIIELISTLEPDAILVQEHWLTPDNLYKLSDLADSNLANAVSILMS